MYVSKEKQDTALNIRIQYVAGLVTERTLVCILYIVANYIC